jgi:hypothetical protein
MNHPLLPWIAAGIFALAVLHTFSTKYFEHLAHAQPRHAGIWHLLGEVEVVFGLWAMVLAIAMFALAGKVQTLEYLDSRNFTEPLFVFAIMVVAGTRPILQACGVLVQQIARLAPLPTAMVNYFLLLSVVPLLGSLITEPAAMTLAALMLRDSVFSARVSERLKYATLGVLFVNISIGGTLTPFAAPPVLMVASTWQALLVAFFLAGLVVLGGQQSWWLQPLLMGLSSDAVFYGATVLTAITDNAALTYLASLVPGLSDEFKVAIVAGAVTGGGLTVIANAPNPAGVAILKGKFDEGVVSAGKLLLAAIPPTIVAAMAFRLL